MINRNALDKKIKVNNRIWELDFIRGLCIILMVMDHSFYNISSLFKSAWLGSGNAWAIEAVQFVDNYFRSDLRLNTRPFVLWAFFVICGISSSFSRSNIKRGIQLAIVAYVLTLATFIAESQFNLYRVIIRFGVLHMLAVSILTWSLIDLITQDKYKTAVACLGLGVILLLLDTNIEYFLKNYTVSNNNYAFIHKELLSTRQGIYSADYFPLIPHMAKFMIGASIGPIIYKRKKTMLPLLDKYRWYRPINFLGRNTLVIFVFHQPIVSLLFALFSAAFITKGNFILF